MEQTLSARQHPSLVAPEKQPRGRWRFARGGQDRADVRDEEGVMDGEIVQSLVLEIPICGGGLFDQPFLLEHAHALVGYGVDHLGAAFAV